MGGSGSGCLMWSQSHGAGLGLSGGLFTYMSGPWAGKTCIAGAGASVSPNPSYLCGLSLQCGASEQPNSLRGHLRFQRCVFWTRQAEETPPFPTWPWKPASVTSAIFYLWRRSQSLPTHTGGPWRPYSPSETKSIKGFVDMF